MKKLISLAFATFMLLVCFAGCAGYQLGAVKPSAFAEIDNIFVPPFKNKTLEPRISSLVTNAVLKQIQMDGTYKVSRERNADAILRGTIEEINKTQLRGVRTDTLRSQELGLFLHVTWYLEDPATGERILARNDCGCEEVKFGSEVIQSAMGSVVGDTIQSVDASYQVGERNAIAVAAEDAAKKLVDQISEGW
ncbi:MAG: LptE family protein [Verrucomicrobiales bacterium]|nr:LptE family protein [Verrucomicrobiales bacterium]